MRIFKTKWQSLPEMLRTALMVTFLIAISATIVFGMTKLIEFSLFEVMQITTRGGA